MKFNSLSACIGLLAVFGACSAASSQDLQAQIDASQKQLDDIKATMWQFLPPSETKPEFFEAYLKQHPQDQAHRDAALWWYELHDTEGRKLLKRHTLLMVQYHPTNASINLCNTTAFYAEPQYLAEVIAALEMQVTLGHHESRLYWILGDACKLAAIPPTTEEGRARFLSYFSLPANTRLRTTVDDKMADKSINYYRQAVAGVDRDPIYRRFYARDLAELLMELDKPKEAVAVCETALPDVDNDAKPNFLVTYGSCLHAAHRLQEAEQILKQVRTFDHEGHQYGPGHATMEAENELGEIALKQGRVDDAVHHLMASCEVQACCHNCTKGFPLELARDLLAAGQKVPVAKYCRTVLTKFTPHQPETKALLAQAERATAR